MMKRYRPVCLLALILVVSLACNYRPIPRDAVSVLPTTTTVSTQPAAAVTPAATEKLLTVCMGQEPASLFLYGDQSSAARTVRQAIYDGPFDWVNFTLTPVILESAPSTANGGASLAPVMVQPGEPLVDVNGKVVKLAEGAQYYPSGCSDLACAAAYTGQAPVQVDQLIVRFQLRPGLQWSDGSPLTAGDSVYSYEVARSLYPLARADLLDRTQLYQAQDDVTVEWRGLPGYHFPGYASVFFTPLPRHAWKDIAAKDLPAVEPASRKPLGWGPYQIDEWTAGDHISLSRNPAYFRSGEGLPAFDRLVFRFIPDRQQAIQALQSGECDFLDESLHLEAEAQQLLELQQGGKAVLAFLPGTAWEHADFGLLPVNSSEMGGPPAFFQAKATRQAVAQCIDRSRLVKEVFGEALAAQVQPPTSYVVAGHPLLNPGVKQYAFDPAAAGVLLEQAGWKDEDANPQTPRVARGITGVMDGTPFEFSFLTTDEPEKQRVAQVMQETLALCGIKMNIDARPVEVVFASGPEGPLFGRNFSLAQFGWVSAIEPSCFLFTTQEIPGPHPQFPRGWGGANASGYSSPEFDRQCQLAEASLPESPAYQPAHFQAQAIFAEDVPVIPLYPRLKLAAARADFCNLSVDPSSESALWNLESFRYGEACAP